MSQRRNTAIVTAIAENMTEENIKASKGMMWKRQRTAQNQTTTNDYVDTDIFDMRLYSKALIQVVELNVNAIKYNVLGCIDPSKWDTIASDQDCAKGASATVEVTKAYAYLKVQVKSAVADTHGKVNVYIAGKTP